MPTNPVGARQACMAFFDHRDPALYLCRRLRGAASLKADMNEDMLTCRAKPVARVLGLIAVAGCIIYAALLTKGAWDYWAPFANLQPTTGHWFPTGFASVRGQGWYEVNDIEMPEWLQWIGAVLNDGDRYEKLPRFIPYSVMPLSMALLLFRFVQVALRLWNGESATLIASHEAEEAAAHGKVVVHAHQRG